MKLGPLSTLPVTCLRPVRAAVALSGLVLVGALAPAAALGQAALSKQDTDAPVQVIADEVVYNPKEQVVIAKGHVELAQGSRILLADYVTYNQQTRLVAANGNVSLVEPTGDVVHAQYLELDDRFQKGFIQSVGVLFKDNSRVAATQGERQDGNVTTLDKAVYSPCEVCREHPERAPVWQVKAVRVVHDEAAQTVAYHDATFEAFGVPVFYLPYFEMPDPSVKRRTGFLQPNFGSSGRLGFYYAQPYFWAIDGQSDLTVTPTVTTKAGTYGTFDYHELTQTGGWNAQASLSYGKEYHNDGSPTSDRPRGHIFANGDFAMNQDWSYGFLAERASSDTYLKRYKFDSPNFLVTQPYINGYFDRSWAGMTAYAFQGLRSIDDNKHTPYVLPLGGFNYVYEPESVGGRVEVGGSALALWRDEGAKQRRLSLNLDWRRPFYTDLGAVVTTTLSLRGDYYDTDDVRSQNRDVSGQVARGLPKGAVEVSYPLVRSGETSRQVIEPMAQLVVAPALSNSRKIGNEDSQSFIFDATNLFSLSRFSGNDLWDSGSHGVVGIQAANYWNSGPTISGLFGQSYQLDHGADYPVNSGLRHGASDYVGKISFSPFTWMDIEHSFRLDKQDFHYRSADIQASFGNTDYRLNLGYVDAPRSVYLTNQRTDEEIYVSGYAHFAPYWAAYADTRQDPSGSTRTLSASFGLFYVDECIEIGGTISRDGTHDRDISPDNSFSFTIRLRNFG